MILGALSDSADFPKHEYNFMDGVSLQPGLGGLFGSPNLQIAWFIDVFGPSAAVHLILAVTLRGEIVKSQWF